MAFSLFNTPFDIVHYREGEEVIELYDLAKDPWETVNLAGDPARVGG